MKTEGVPTPKKAQQLDLNFESQEEGGKSLTHIIQEKRRKGEPLTQKESDFLQTLLAEEREDDQYRHGH